MSNLGVHHQQFRSQSGDDSEGNLITLWPLATETDTFLGRTFGSEFRPAPDSSLAADFAPGFDGAKNSDYIRCNESVSLLCRTPWVGFNQTNLSLRSPGD
jgi:hypothetical protein